MGYFFTEHVCSVPSVASNFDFLKFATPITSLVFVVLPIITPIMLAQLVQCKIFFKPNNDGFQTMIK